MDNGPIAVSAPGTSLTGAVGKDVTFNTRYPFAKLDSTNQVSFQNINLIFFKDPPSPDGTILTSNTTTVYTFPHGYTYVPSTWFQAFRSVGAALQDGETNNRYPNYLLENGTICAWSSADNSNFATIGMTVDATNVYIQVTKNYAASFGTDVSLLGYTLLIRVYIFVNDLSGTDVPSQA